MISTATKPLTDNRTQFANNLIPKPNQLTKNKNPWADPKIKKNSEFNETLMKEIYPRIYLPAFYPSIEKYLRHAFF